MGGCHSSDSVVVAGPLKEAKPQKLFYEKYRCQGQWEEDIKADNEKMYEDTEEGAESMPPLTADGIEEYKSMCRYFYNEINA